VTCSHCGSENREGRKFCAECGKPLSAACPACGAANEPGERFCGECGAPLGAQAAAPSGPAAERRLVSVLFADLVGFTSLSERRDAEETRELLSRYFETAQRLISLYGGTVEKFIGDAVMAVWGTPTATEDDAERAVRAALDLVAAVTALGDELQLPALRARAGVLTGEAAVTLGAEGQGMVAGDLVNTASRIQSAADPGTVLVGEATRRATEQAVAYEDAGSHELKGKGGLTLLWKALRVVSGARGSLKSQGLEAPFVGRDRELHQIKELFHACADGGKAHLVSITGIAGIGKSRLAWEFYKYFDGLPQVTYWHRGRCLAYGEGVTYWALADMVRMRCRIAEDDEPGTAAQKLHASVEEHLSNPDERRFVEPRLAQLLGLAEHELGDRQDLFAAWRLFFERLADVYPTVLAFEDLQWADESLLDFVEYLLEWSRNLPLYVVTLARPELLERRPTWGAGHRNFTSLYLEPLSQGAMEELLAGLVPGLPENVRAQILARAEGVPLYAVETVRMLLDRGLLVLDGASYRPVGEIASLEVPETLHALIAARLDGLSAAERRVLQDGCVLGKSFTRAGLAALSELAETELDPLLTALVRKEVLGVQADPRSPEHGQYGFLQDLVRHVAYETLSRRERRTRHLAAAAHLESTHAEEDELVEVIASHYLAANEAVPDAPDAAEIREKARQTLVRAGDRAAALGAPGEAQRYLEQAAQLAEAPIERAELLDRAGWLALSAARPERAIELLAESLGLYEAEGQTHTAARVASRLAEVEYRLGRLDAALTRVEQVFEVISGDEPDEDLALVATRLGSAYAFAGDLARAEERVGLALDIGESLGLPEPLTRAFISKAYIAASRGHPEEAFAYLSRGLAIALEHGLHEAATTMYFNLSDGSFRCDRYADALGYLEQALELARRRGDRPSEWSVLAEMTYPLYMLGRWEESLAALEDLTDEQIGSGAMFLSMLTSVLEIHIHRGRLDKAQQLFALFSRLETSADVQEHGIWLGGAAALRRAQGDYGGALEAGEAAVAMAEKVGIGHQVVKQGLVEAIEAALALGREDSARELLSKLDAIPPGLRPPYLSAQAHRFRARLDGDPAGFRTAADAFGELGVPFWRAVSLLELGEAGVEEARGTFERLEAAPWLERAGAPVEAVAG
jgi:class 3 adenylate cyclase/tetratricopeptide (TPR) repeat protein